MCIFAYIYRWHLAQCLANTSTQQKLIHFPSLYKPVLFNVASWKMSAVSTQFGTLLLHSVPHSYPCDRHLVGRALGVLIAVASSTLHLARSQSSQPSPSGAC